MENIIINFQSDAAGLQPGIEGLEQIGLLDKENADIAKATMAAYQNRDKALSDTTKNSISQLDKLTSYFKNLDKSIVGGAYTKSLKDLEKAIAGVGTNYKALSTAIDVAKKKQAELKPNSAEWKELDKQIASATEVLNSFAQQQEATEKKTVSLRTQIKQLKDEIASRLESGESGPELDALIEKAGELDDKMRDINATIKNTGSDTRNIEGLISIAGAGVGVFSALEGSMQLFGAETEDTQKAMRKFFAVMEVLQGIEQVQNALQKESAATLLIENAQRKIATLQTSLQTGAESSNIVVKYASIVASKALNAVMAASPAGILLLAIGALAGAMLYFTSNTREAARAQAELNAALDSAGKLLDAELTGMERANEKIVAQMKNRGASDSDLTDREIRFSKLRIEAKNRELANLQATADNQALMENASAEDRKKLFEKMNDLEQSALDDQTDIIVKQREQERIAFEQGIKNTQSYINARVDLVKRGSKEELVAQIAAVKEAAAVQTNTRLNPNLTAGEIAAVYAEANRKIKEINTNFRIQDLQDQKNYFDAAVASQKEGSKEQYLARLASLEAQNSIDNANAAKEFEDQKRFNAAKLKNDSEYFKARQELTDAYNRQVAEDAINTRISQTNSDISALTLQNADATNARLLAAKKKLVDDQAALEVVGITYSEHNEELRRAKIKAVYDKALADKVQLEKDKTKAEIDEGLKATTGILDTQARIAKLFLDSDETTWKKRKEATANYYDYQKAKISANQLANQQAYDNDLISFTDYLNTKQSLDADNMENEQARHKAFLEFYEAERQFAQETAINLANIAFNANKKNYDYEEQRIEELHDKKLITDAQYNKQLKKLRREQSEDEKAQAIFTMLVNEGPALIKALQQGGLPAIAAVSALFFGLLGTLTATDVPQYKTGEIKIQGPGTETSDSIHARISKGESVIKASMTRKHEDALRAINEDRFMPYLMKYELPKLYQNMTMPQLPDFVQTVTNNHNTQFDYEKLGDILAQKIADNPHLQINMDENGLSLSVLRNNTRTNYVNKKLNL